MKSIILLNLFLALAVRAFSNEIPIQWTDDMTLTLKHFGGNLSCVNEAVIEKRGYHSYYADGVNGFTALFFSDHELNIIIETLNRLQLNAIQTFTRDSSTPDKPTNLIRLKWKTGSIDICSNATTEVSANDLEKFLEINTYLINLLKEKGVVWP